MTHILDGANTSAQWYQDSYPGASVFSRLDKFLLHTTETLGWPGYSGGASAPNATYHPRLRQIRQHFGANRSARALRDPSGTAVRENRDNVFQLEIICYSDRAVGQRFGGLWVGDLTATHMRDIAAMILQLRRDWNLPVRSSVTWREGRTTAYNDVRLSGPEYDAYRGILGHVHCSGNSHWDPGGFYYSRLEDALSWQLVNNPIFTDITFDSSDTDIDISPKEDDVSEADVRNALKQSLEEAASRDTPYGRQLGDALWAVLKEPIIDGLLTGRELPRSMIDDEGLGLAVARLRRGVAKLEAGQMDPAELATAIVARLPDSGLDQATVEAAFRAVLGSLDDA